MKNGNSTGQIRNFELRRDTDAFASNKLNTKQGKGNLMRGNGVGTWVRLSVLASAAAIFVAIFLVRVEVRRNGPVFSSSMAAKNPIASSRNLGFGRGIRGARSSIGGFFETLGRSLWKEKGRERGRAYQRECEREIELKWVWIGSDRRA